LLVAEDGRALVGYAAVFVRDAIAFLADLFVVPAWQSHGLGGARLRRVLADPAAVRCTMSSLDPRTLTLYAHADMRPRWPHLHLAAVSPTLGLLPGGDLTAAAAGSDDAEFAASDARASGPSHPNDHAFWRALGAVPLWFARGGVQIGYGYVWVRPTSGSGTEVRLGPLGAWTPDDASACIGAALRWAAERDVDPQARTYRVAVPASHAALAPLLRAGVHIIEMEIFCSSRDEPFCDQRS